MTQPEIRLTRYAESCGMRLGAFDGDMPVIEIDFVLEKVSGAPGLFHGGLIGGMLEVAMLAALQAKVGGAMAAPRFKPVNITVEYMRPAVKTGTLFARGEIVRFGRRLSYVRATAWQDDPAKAVAMASSNFLTAGI
ncbi:hypothetical protein BH10PSE13_BH10PSE13_17200 [soil metagenome]